MIDKVPRQLSAEQQQDLQALSRQVMAQMELRQQWAQAVDILAYRIQVQEALRESEERFEAFMDNSPIVAFLKDEDGRFSYVNQPFLDRFGLRREQVIGQDDTALWPNLALALREHDLQVLEGDETVPTPDGMSQFWQVWKFPLKRGGGQGRFLAGVALDITENKRYEQ